GRPAAARGAGPGDRPRAPGLPHGRAAFEPRRPTALSDARGAETLAEVDWCDHGLRDARPARGDDDGRPDRGDVGGPAAAARDPGRDLRATRQPLRGWLLALASPGSAR